MVAGGRRGVRRRSAHAGAASASGHEERARGRRASASRRPFVAGSTAVIPPDDVARREARELATNRQEEILHPPYPVWRWYVDINGGFFHRCKSYFAFDIGFIYMLYIYSNLAEPMEYI